MSIVCVVVLCLAVFVPRPAADVHTVGPGADFEQIHEALAAAVDGDTLLVASGTYEGFIVDGLSVSIVADSGETALIDGPVVIRNLGVGQSVLLAGLVWDGVYPSVSTISQLLDVDGNQGAVRVERCTVQGPISVFGTARMTGVRISDSDDVALVDCFVEAGTPNTISVPEAGDPAVEVATSTVTLDGCTLVGGLGGEGSPAFLPNGAVGGAALDVTDAVVVLSGCDLTGGVGGRGAACVQEQNGNGGDGGVGLRASGASTLSSRATTVAGGAGGQGGSSGFGCFNPGIDGQVGANVVGTSVVPVPGPHRTWASAVPVRELEPFVASVTATPGDWAALLWSAVPENAPVVGVPGQLLVSLGPPTNLRLLGVVPGGGVLALPAALPELGPGVESARVFTQLLVQAPGGELHLGAPLTLVALDAAF